MQGHHHESQTAQFFGFAPDFSDQLKSMNDLEKTLKIKQEQEEKKAAEEAARNAKPYHMDLYNIPDCFHRAIRDIRDKEHLEYVFKGGRGSTKSTTVGMTIVELMKNNHDIHAVVCRKVGNTIKDSVYNKIKWAIEKQEFTEEFDSKLSPMEITLKATGQKIYFRGADDPDKEGNVISGYPDGNDHAISALRYAYEPLFNRRGNSA